MLAKQRHIDFLAHYSLYFLPGLASNLAFLPPRPWLTNYINKNKLGTTNYLKTQSFRKLGKAGVPTLVLFWQTVHI